MMHYTPDGDDQIVSRYSQPATYPSVVFPWYILTETRLDVTRALKR